MKHFLLFIFATLISTKSWAVMTASSPCLNVSVIKVTQFGAKGDGVADNVLPFQAAFDYVKKCMAQNYYMHTVHVPAGNYNFLPSTSPNGIWIHSNTVFEGDTDSKGALKSILKVSNINKAITFSVFFQIRDEQNITINKLSFIGNGVVVRDANKVANDWSGMGIYVFAQFAPKPLNHFLIQGCNFDNFSGSQYVGVENQTLHKITGVTIAKNTFTSRVGNNGDPSNIMYLSTAINIEGSMINRKGIIEGTLIYDNIIDAAHIKMGISIWSGVYDAHIYGNHIYNAGSDAPDDTGGYGINVYSNTYDSGGGGIHPDWIFIDNNSIYSPKSCGIYTAAVDRVWVRGNIIAGQTDRIAGTLPKGAIAINALGTPAGSITIVNNNISDSFFGISAVNGEGSSVTIQGNTISNISANGKGIYVEIYPTANLTQVYDDKIDGGGHAGTSSVVVKFVGKNSYTFLQLKNIVQLNTQYKSRFYEYNQHSLNYEPLSDVAAINKVTGSLIDNLWLCTSYLPGAAAIEIDSPSNHGCTKQISF